ncbi:hypothetical protein CPB84DRAFT_127943 [Gymnopilus junonius]|uniref:Uncharacterized protein n=1 Tax=Gymnopilus junonius TaxID=109634 RepID=A0A9P5NIR3_GYMJU|nr:hypothetical protein CPB84DRAFT_127943 [Gymnopilus junonius]
MQSALCMQWFATVCTTCCSIALYKKWKTLLPLLVKLLLAYMAGSIGKPVQIVSLDLEGYGEYKCGASCEVREVTILCLYFDHMYNWHWLFILVYS